MKRSSYKRACCAVLVTCVHQALWAQVIVEDTLTGPSSSYDWKALNGACLTAGNNSGSIPACVGLPYYNGSTQVGGTDGRLPDRPGQGALRLTNGDTVLLGLNSIFKSGAVVSNFTFPTTQGMRLTFTAVTYGGNGLDGHGADGMSFFLADGSRPPGIGGSGGSLGYTCRNVLFNSSSDTFDTVVGGPDDIPSNYDGVDSGYVAIGIDEYGNFANPADSTDTGPGFKPGRIILRGAGDTRWATLNKKFPLYYPASLSESGKALAVRNACATGTPWNYSGSTITDANGSSVPNGSATTERLAYNYPYLASSNLPNGVSIENQQSVAMPRRGAAVPITYALSLTQDGRLDFSYSINGGTAQPVLSNTPIAASNGPVPASFRFGFSGSTGGGSNVHEITCFKAAPLDDASSSASVNAQPASRVRAGTQVYLAYNHPTNWWGQLTAQDIVDDAAADRVAISPIANWDAHCTLTGGACQAMGAGAPLVKAQLPDDRKILGWNGSAGIGLRWGNLTPAQQASLTAGDAAVSDARLRFLRGERSQEVANAGPLRTRTGVLGDLPDSSPTWVGPPASPYQRSWSDALHAKSIAAEATGQSYAAFRTAYGGRQNLVYVGANDGLLHAFRAGAYNGENFIADGATPNDGREALAYMPAAVLGSIHSTDSSLDFSSPRYAHNLYVDATPGVGDLYYAGKWHTWLVSGLGPGRDASGPIADKAATATGTIFALDITDPNRFSESNAASLVLGEWSSATIRCSNIADCGSFLGSTSGTPFIRRLHNGNWAALFGNGLNSAKGTAGLFVMLVDASTGSISFRYIDTGYGATNGAKNGIVQVTPADLDGDHIADYVYAGDVLGNVWRFDLSSSDPSEWLPSAAPLFSTAAGQPITSKVAVAAVPGSGASAKPRVIVSFGTGQKLTQTRTSAASYASASQALYGIWDWNMSGWNAKAGSQGQYQSLAAPQSVGLAGLQMQSVTSTLPGDSAASGYRTVSRNPVCWKGVSSCQSGNDMFGWTLPLPSATEQVIYNPVLSFGMLVVNTTIAPASAATSCDQQAATGFTMAIGVADGGAAPRRYFTDTASDNIAGVGLNAVGTPSVITARKKAYLVNQTVFGKGSVTTISPPPGPGTRLNWIQLR